MHGAVRIPSRHPPSAVRGFADLVLATDVPPLEGPKLGYLWSLLWNDAKQDILTGTINTTSGSAGTFFFFSMSLHSFH